MWFKGDLHHITVIHKSDPDCGMTVLGANANQSEVSVSFFHGKYICRMDTARISEAYLLLLFISIRNHPSGWGICRPLGTIQYWATMDFTVAARQHEAPASTPKFVPILSQPSHSVSKMNFSTFEIRNLTDTFAIGSHLGGAHPVLEHRGRPNLGSVSER